jgi:O-6-methylguanine DNA methyltransferase
MRLAHVEVRRAGFHVHAWSSPEGLAAVRFGAVPEVGTEPGGRPVRGIVVAEGSPDPRLAALARALERYFSGEPLRWDGELDQRGTTEFQRLVFASVREVPHGEVTTYRAVARRIGRPSAVRAVGNALHRNPFALVVPCHRVLREGGDPGGYAGGPGTKRRLLALESGQIEFAFREAES